MLSMGHYMVWLGTAQILPMDVSLVQVFEGLQRDDVLGVVGRGTLRHSSRSSMENRESRLLACRRSKAERVWLVIITLKPATAWGSPQKPSPMADAACAHCTTWQHQVKIHVMSFCLFMSAAVAVWLSL